MIRHDFSALRRTVRHDADVSPQARLLFEDLCELSARDGFCSAGDRHFEEAYNVERRTVRRWLKELRDAGYLAVEGSTSTRRIAPANPEPSDQLRTQDDLSARTPSVLSPRTPSVLSPRTPGVLSGPSLGHPMVSSLGHPMVDTKSINSNTGEREARAPARHGNDDDGFVPPALEQVLARASVAGVDAQVAEGFFWHYDAQGWRTSGHDSPRIRSWESKLMSWKHREAGFARTAAGRSRAQSPLEPVLADDLAAVLAAHPALSREHFYQAGRDSRSGQARWQLRPEHAALAAPTP